MADKEWYAILILLIMGKRGVPVNLACLKKPMANVALNPEPNFFDNLVKSPAFDGVVCNKATHLRVQGGTMFRTFPNIFSEFYQK